MMKSYTIEELDKLPSQTDWARVNAMRDEDIQEDPDNPFLTAEDFRHAVFVPAGAGWGAIKTAIDEVNRRVEAERKQQMTIRFDGDVVAWFKSFGRGYQSRMNTVLREYMLATQRMEKIGRSGSTTAFTGLAEDGR